MAALSGDQQLAALYAAGDMYELFAESHLGLTGSRKAAKQLFLSYAYGMSRKALVDAAVELGAKREKAKDAFRIFARYEEWKKEVCTEFQRTGRIATEMRSDEHTSELQSLMRISYDVFCLTKKNVTNTNITHTY